MPDSFDHRVLFFLWPAGGALESMKPAFFLSIGQADRHRQLGEGKLTWNRCCRKNLTTTLLYREKGMKSKPKAEKVAPADFAGFRSHFFVATPCHHFAAKMSSYMSIPWDMCLSLPTRSLLRMHRRQTAWSGNLLLKFTCAETSTIFHLKSDKIGQPN